MPRGFRGESVAQEARGGSRAAVERGRAAASRSFQTAPMEDSSRFEQANPNRDERGSYNPGAIDREALTYDQFMTATGRSETNPYGDQGFFSRVFGIDPSKINYAASTPGGIATLNQVNALAYDQYMNPRDAQGNIRGMLREGSPTRSGTVVYDPTMETNLGIMGAIPIVGPLLRRANRRSALNISAYDNPLFSDMSDMGNELGAFPAPPLEDPIEAIAPLGSPAPAATNIPTAMELRGDRINRTVAELQRATADFPDAASVPGAIQVSSPVSSLPDYEEMVGATPEESGTYILGGQIAPTSGYERVYSIEGTTPAEQDYLREIRTDDLIYDMPYPGQPPRQVRNMDEPLRLPGLF